MDYKEIDYSDELHQIANKIAIARAKDEYLKWGGFYEVFEVEEELIKKDILVSYAKNIIYQDIVPRYKIRNSEIVEKLFFYLLSNATGIMNYTTLAKTFEISDKTIREYINYFEDVFMLKRLDKFHNKPKERIKSFKKIYALDNGFLQIAPTLSKNLGNALENMVFIMLNQKFEELYYLKDGVEIDFFSYDTHYQVSYDISEEKTRKRELGAFEYFKSENKAKNILVTYNTNEDIENINIVSIEKFIFNTLKDKI